MDYLIKRYRSLLARTDTRFTRGLLDKIQWESRGIGIAGARGTGKSTLMLQHIASNRNPEEAIYLSMDDLYFQEHTLSSVIEEFLLIGGKYMYLDEVHKYPNWKREIKNIYDFNPNLNMVISGSSIVALQESSVDLSRRVVWYELPELSFREYLSIQHEISLPMFSLDEILNHHTKIASEVIETVGAPIKYFREFLTFGAYPFIKEGEQDYFVKLNQIMNLIIDYDISEIQSFEPATLHKVKQLLFILSQSVPFKPNITKLAEKLSVSRKKLLELLRILDQARLIISLYSATKGVSLLNKPEKLFLHNTSLIAALSKENQNIGNVRETFFVSQLMGAGHEINYVPHTDFVVDGSLYFEIGGQNKSSKQLQNKEQSYLGIDNLEHGYGNKIPLWLFGLLY